MKEKLLVSEMREGDLGYTTPWAFYMNGRLNLPYVYSNRFGTACTEVELRCGEIVPTEAGRKSIDDYRKSSDDLMSRRPNAIPVDSLV